MASEDDQELLTQYTRRVRNSTNRDIQREGSFRKIARRAESLLRRVFYFILRIRYRNPRLTSPILLKDIGKILVIPYGDAIGDMIVATPIWRSIKRRNPGCQVGVVTSLRNISLVDRDPDVDFTHQFTTLKNFRKNEELKSARGKSYDVILNLHFTRQTDYGFVANYIGANAIKITADHPRRTLYETFFNYIGRRKRHTTNIAHHCLELLSEAVQCEPPLTLEEARPSLVIPVEVTNEVVKRLKQLGSADSKFILINTQAATPFREWGIPRSIEFANEFALREQEYVAILISGPYQHAELRKAVSANQNSRVLFFQTSDDLLALAALVQQAALVVTPETAITHFASAVRTPAVVLLPDPDHLPIEWLPVGNPARLTAPSKSGEPVETIQVSEVLRLALSLQSGEWTATQTSLNDTDTPHPMFQRSEGNRLLAEFSKDVLTEPKSVDR